MIDKQLYSKIAKENGEVASWAVWAKASTGGTVRENISNMEIFDITKNPSTLNTLKNNVVMVALNFARKLKTPEPFLNFHDPNLYGQDYKIRYAFEGTEYYGAYMTDIIKNYPQLLANDVLIHLRNNPDEVRKHIEVFRKEMKFIGANKPVILAFGHAAYDILKNHLLDGSDYSKLIRLTHYSHHISKENYRIDTLEKIRIAYL